MGIILMLIFGALVGWLASILMGTDAQMGAMANIIIGIVGSFLGGLLYTLLFRGDADLTDAFMNFRLKSIIVSLIGAMVLLALLKFLRKGNAM